MLPLVPGQRVLGVGVGVAGAMAVGTGAKAKVVDVVEGGRGGREGGVRRRRGRARGGGIVGGGGVLLGRGPLALEAPPVQLVLVVRGREAVRLVGGRRGRFGVAGVVVRRRRSSGRAGV